MAGNGEKTKVKINVCCWRVNHSTHTTTSCRTDGLIAVKKPHPNQERMGAARERQNPTVKKAAVGGAPFPKISGFGICTMHDIDEGLPDGRNFGSLQTKTRQIDVGDGVEG